MSAALQTDPLADTQPARVIVHHCSCGRMYDQGSWDALPFVGTTTLSELFVHELRDCVCKSTRSLLKGPSSFAETLSPARLVDEWCALREQAVEARARREIAVLLSVEAEQDILHALLVQRVGTEETAARLEAARWMTL